MRTTRRPFAVVLCAAVAVTVLAGCAGADDPTDSSAAARPGPTASSSLESDSAVEDDLVALEQEYDATIGVVAVQTASGRSVSYGGDRRFGFASTIKVFAAAEFLRTVDGADRDDLVYWTADEVAAAGHAPVTSQHVDEGMTYEQLVEAAVRYSDNAALNLIFDRVGGPEALDAAFADLGDTTTEVVNNEPALNTIEPGSTSDTSTAAAFTALLATYLNETTLPAEDRALLIDWMSDNRTGDALIRAGAPDGWQVADKSGGAGPIRNDIAIVTPLEGAPIVITILTSRNNPSVAFDDSLVERTATIVLNALTTGP